MTSATATLQVLPSIQDDIFTDIARVAHCHRSFSTAGQVINVRCNGRSVPLVARGAPKGQQGVIFLDQRTRNRLDLKPNAVADFEFTPRRMDRTDTLGVECVGAHVAHCRAAGRAVDRIGGDRVPAGRDLAGTGADAGRWSERLIRHPHTGAVTAPPIAAAARAAPRIAPSI